MTKSRCYPFLSLAVLLLVGSLPLSGQGAPPCEQAEEHRSLDFWIGSWDVVDSSGQRVGTNRIEKAQQGCLLEERWTSSAGGTGQSMNYFDPADGVWKQHWVDQGGAVVEYTGRVEDGILRYQGRHVRLDGTVTTARVVIEPLDDGRLHHLIEHSKDDGGTWSVYFDATYIPVGGQIAAAVPATVIPVIVAEPVMQEPVTQEQVVEEPAEDVGAEAAVAAATAAGVAAEEPAADPVPVVETPQPTRSTPVTPEPAPSTPAQERAQPQAARQTQEEGSSVKAVTRELQREEIPVEQAPELVMASPMVLEIVPGDVDEYPENAAWRTEETAGFICNEVKINRVGVGHESKGDSVDLIVTVNLYTHKRSRKTSLLLEVIKDDQVVASDELKNVRVGLNIPAHGTDGRDVTSEMRISREQFDGLFAGDARPSLRLTLTVP